MSETSSATTPEPSETTRPPAAEVPQRVRPYRGGGRAGIGLWVLTRALSFVLLVTTERVVGGDVLYYWRKVAALPDVGLAGTLQEYPTPVVWLLSIPQVVSGGSRLLYVAGFVGLMLLLDALMTYLLWRSAGRRHELGVDLWIFYVFLLGPLTFTRFDVLPAVLAGGALLAARTRPWLTGALTGLGAAVKLWPALLLGAFAVRRAGRGRLLVGFVVVGFGLAALSLVTGGLSRLFSPLAWQSGRGLQIESVWAVPLMVARALDPSRFEVHLSAFLAAEVFGPGVATWVVVSTVATAVGLLVTLVLFVRGFRCPEVTSIGLGLLVLATIAITIVTNKTLSPQYMVWLGGPAAVLLLSRSAEGPRWRRVVDRVAVELLVLAVLTHVLYPYFYQGLLGHRSTTLLVVATVVAALRNLALLVVTVEICRYAWSALARPRTT